MKPDKNWTDEEEKAVEEYAKAFVDAHLRMRKIAVKLLERHESAYVEKHLQKAVKKLGGDGIYG